MNVAILKTISSALKATTLLSSLMLLSACQGNQQPQVIAPVFSIQQQLQASGQLTQLLDSFQSWQLDSSPMSQSYRGKKTNYDKWDDLSDDFNQQQNKKIALFLLDANAIEKDALEYQQGLSLDVLIYDLQQSIKFEPYKHLNYPLNQMYGLHTEIPTFMLNIHQIESIQDARDYVARIRGVKPLFNELINQLKTREALGISPPKFVYDLVIKASQEQLKGYPLDKSKVHHIIWADFLSKVETLGMYDSSKKVLTQGLKKALKRNYKPAYNKLVKYLKESSAKVGQDKIRHRLILTLKRIVKVRLRLVNIRKRKIR